MYGKVERDERREFSGGERGGKEEGERERRKEGKTKKKKAIGREQGVLVEGNAANDRGRGGGVGADFFFLLALFCCFPPPPPPPRHTQTHTTFMGEWVC